MEGGGKDEGRSEEKMGQAKTDYFN